MNGRSRQQHRVCPLRFVREVPCQHSWHTAGMDPQAAALRSGRRPPVRRGVPAEGAVRDGYRPLRHPVSSLALGPRGWIQAGNFAVAGTLFLAGAAGLARAWLCSSGWLRSWTPLPDTQGCVEFMANGRRLTAFAKTCPCESHGHRRVCRLGQAWPEAASARVAVTSADEPADLAESVHCFGQERPEDVEGVRWYRVNPDPGVDVAFFAALGEQLSFLQDRIAGACVDQDGRQPAQVGMQRIERGVVTGLTAKIGLGEAPGQVGREENGRFLGRSLGPSFQVDPGTQQHRAGGQRDVTLAQGEQQRHSQPAGRRRRPLVQR